MQGYKGSVLMANDEKILGLIEKIYIEMQQGFQKVNVEM